MLLILQAYINLSVCAYIGACNLNSMLYIQMQNHVCICRQTCPPPQKKKEKETSFFSSAKHYDVISWKKSGIQFY